MKIIIAVLFFLLVGCSPQPDRPTIAPNITPITIILQKEFDFRAGAADMCVLLPKNNTNSEPTYTRNECISIVKNMISAGYYSNYLGAIDNQTRSLVFYSGALNLCVYVGRPRETCGSFVEGLQSMSRFENYLKELEEASSTNTPTGPQG